MKLQGNLMGFYLFEDKQKMFSTLSKRLHLIGLRSVLVISLFFTSVYLLNGQVPADTVKYWKVNGKTSLNFSQVSLSNWSEGGDGSVAGAFLFGITANRLKGLNSWDNSFDFEYGMTKNNSESLRKSVDQIYLSSKYGYDIGKHWYLSALFDFKSQSAKGFNYPNTNEYISRFFAPAYMNFALGFDFKPNKDFSLFLSPLSTKLTFVLDDSLSASGAFGVDPGSRFRSELGSYLKMVYIKKSLMKNVDFQTRLDLFSNYLKNPQNIDVNWDVKFDMKINDILSANFGTTLKYDDDIKYIDGNGLKHGARLQFKQFLGVGLSIKF
jgi:hypothetical protein